MGKTTVCATVGVAAARSGLNVLMVELNGHSTLGRPFGIDDVPYDPVEVEVPTGAAEAAVAGRLAIRQITPDDALLEYLSDHGLQRIGGRLLRTGAIDVVSSAAPGIRDLLALGKIRALEQTDAFDLILVDAPAAGHAITFLRSATGLSETGEGPVRDQAELVLEMLGDSARCQVMLVSLAEETPVTETIETAFSLEEDVGIQLGPVVVNAVIEEVAGLSEAVDAPAGASERSEMALAAARYRLRRQHGQRIEIDRLVAELPLPSLELPFLFTTELGADEIGVLADRLGRALDAIELTP